MTAVEFTEAGVVVGVVDVRGDEFVGSAALVAVAQSRIQVARIRHPDMSTADAVRSLDGWSNGYLSARLVGR